MFRTSKSEKRKKSWTAGPEQRNITIMKDMVTKTLKSSRTRNGHLRECCAWNAVIGVAATLAVFGEAE